MLVKVSIPSPSATDPFYIIFTHNSCIFVLLSINVTFAFYFLLFVDMFRPHTAIFKCYIIFYRSWCSVMPFFPYARVPAMCSCWWCAYCQCPCVRIFVLSLWPPCCLFYIIPSFYLRLFFHSVSIKISVRCTTYSPTLCSSGQSSWLQIRRSRVQFPGTTRKKNSEFGTGSTQPREYNWGATWKKK
jgi:hypothetical protein